MRLVERLKSETDHEYSANALRIRAQGTESEWVFPSKRSKTGHITHTAIEKPFRQARNDAKLPEELVLYSARHSFATDMLDRTGNIKLVSDVLGHENVIKTQNTCTRLSRI